MSIITELFNKSKTLSTSRCIGKRFFARNGVSTMRCHLISFCHQTFSNSFDPSRPPSLGISNTRRLMLSWPIIRETSLKQKQLRDLLLLLNSATPLISMDDFRKVFLLLWESSVSIFIEMIVASCLFRLKVKNGSDGSDEERLWDIFKKKLQNTVENVCLFWRLLVSQILKSVSLCKVSRENFMLPLVI